MRLSFVLLFLSLIISVRGQKSNRFLLLGETKFYDNKTIFVQGGAIPKYNEFEFIKKSRSKEKNSFTPIIVHNNKFIVSGKLSYPHPFMISYYNSDSNLVYSSMPFFIDKERVKLNFSDLSKNKNLGKQINTKANIEYQAMRKIFSSTKKEDDKADDLQAKLIQMADYIKNNPNSYVALWELVFDYAYTDNDNYKEIILKNSQLLSDKIKKTKTYNALVNDIIKDLELSVGKIFSKIKIDSLGEIDSLYLNSRYTLIDFWYSHCKPCIEQFPELKKLYESFAKKKFEIIGISIDNETNIMDWKAIIKEYNLSWPQGIDINGVQTENLNIRKFPTNFLLNENGKIIRKDISLNELENFLNENTN